MNVCNILEIIGRAINKAQDPKSVNENAPYNLHDPINQLIKHCNDGINGKIDPRTQFFF